jgi:hypothetical protein
MRIFLILSLALGLLFALTAPVTASWDAKVTGGGLREITGGIGTWYTTIAISALDKDGQVRGHLQYSRNEQFSGAISALCMNAKVEHIVISGDGSMAAAGGPLEVRHDPGGTAGPDWEWMVVTVKEGGTDADDTIAVWVFTEADARDYLDNDPFNITFIGTIVHGDINIRTG